MTQPADVTVVLSASAARFLWATVEHLNTLKALPGNNDQALQTSAWLDEIAAATRRALDSEAPEFEPGHRTPPLINGLCAECRRLSRKPNHQILAENDRLRADVERLDAQLRAVHETLNGVGAPVLDDGALLNANGRLVDWLDGRRIAGWRGPDPMRDAR